MAAQIGQHSRRRANLRLSPQTLARRKPVTPTQKSGQVEAHGPGKTAGWTQSSIR